MSNTQIDNAKDIDAVIPMYNLIEYSDIYSNISGTLRQYFSDKQTVSPNDAIIDFNAANITDVFNFNEKITGQTNDNGTKNVEMMVTLKY